MDIFAVLATSDQDINGLLSGIRWTSSALSFSFPTSRTQYVGYRPDSEIATFQPLNLQTQKAIQSALSQYASVANLSFAQNTLDPGSATLRFGRSDARGGGVAWAYYPHPAEQGGDVWLGTGGWAPVKGDWGWSTALHEIGHALGLKHGHERGGAAGVAMTTAHDGMEFSVMTYRSYVGGPPSAVSGEVYGEAQTLMMYDIAAIQHMYGANFTSHSDNSFYTFSSSTGEMFINGVGQGAPGANRVFLTIWDGGGNDTYDFSNYTTGQTINLAPGGWSLMSQQQRAYRGDGHYAQGNVYNALQYQGDMRSLIENAIGGSGNDTLIGNDTGNGLDGGQGADTLVGGRGDDSYMVDNAGDVVMEQAGEGFDGVYSSVDYNLAANVEMLVMQGGAFIGRGNNLNNIIVGTAGDNRIDGLGGADTMAGGKGDDWYWVDNLGDTVIENAGQGIADRVLSSLYEYNLAANVEVLVMENGAIIGRGNELNNTIWGTAGNNLIDGLAGADTMAGGAGNDHYWIDNPGDVVIEYAGQGTADRVVSRLHEYNLAANVEELFMEGNAFIGRGNNLNNWIVGTAGDNLIDGLGGADTMAGYAGNDHYWVDNPGDVVIETAGQGTADRVVSRIYEYNLAANVEELSMEDNAFIGRGNELNNSIWGTAGDNRIDGLGGADTMAGGNGNDHYWVDNPGDVVIEYAGQGTADRVVSRISEYNLAANVEELSMEGGAIIGRGNDLNNTIWGTAGNNHIEGQGGADTMMGGKGDDWYWVENPGDVVIEYAGEGADGVLSSLYEYNLSANVEILAMQGGAIIGRGNDLNNTIWGTAGNNLIDGLGGADTMMGGGGNDHYWVDNPGDVVIEYAGEGTADRVVSRISEYNLAANVEVLVMENGAIIGRGNELNNTIWGTAGNNHIEGQGGADTMMGGKGDDWYWVENPGDVVIEYAGEGADGVLSSLYEYNLSANVEILAMQGGAIIGRGNDLNNTIWGTAGDNRIDGLGGADIMAGGDGNDHYWVDNPGDTVLENAGQGTADRVVSRIYEYNLAANVEVLVMENGAIIGRGNDLNNTIWGTAGDNWIDGLAGVDTMVGGGGNDYYWVENTGDQVIEYTNEGMDTVMSSVNYALTANVEYLVLTDSAYYGWGNALNNNLVGYDGTQVLNGGAGADWMWGGKGDDAYCVDNTGDQVIEYTHEGMDTVMSSVSYALTANVEYLVLTGSAYYGWGNALNNNLVAYDGAQVLNGGAGADWMWGGTGSDTYLFARGDGADRIIEDDATVGSTDVLQFQGSISADQIWLRHIDNDLEVSLIGTNDKVTIQNWYSGNQYHLEQIKSSDGRTLLDSSVNTLVQAMAAFAPPGQTALPASYSTALAPVIAANWF